jgi:hypothetical protein
MDFDPPTERPEYRVRKPKAYGDLPAEVIKKMLGFK